MEAYNWGIIGTGWIAGEMAEALNTLGRGVYGVSGHSQEKAASFAEKYGIEHVYEDDTALIQDPAIDIVYIATPHNTHYDLIEKALDAGKHVFCEKSITLNDRQLKTCLKKADEKNLVLCDGTTLLHMPLFKALKKRIKSGALGDIKMIQVSYGIDKTYNPDNRFFSKDLAGGALMDIGLYAISFARLFMDSQPNVILTSAAMTDTGVDDLSGIILKNPDSQMAVISLSLQALQPEQAVVCGTKGYVIVKNFPRADCAEIVWSDDFSEEVVEEGTSDRTLEYEVLDMEDYIKNRTGKDMLCLVYDVMKLLTAVRNQWGLHYPDE